ncbi:choline/carnitine O-acyltransferase [archaeon]|nr:MAG: choline/carnitine O-acyltransferase [archaeon]
MCTNTVARAVSRALGRADADDAAEPAQRSAQKLCTTAPLPWHIPPALSAQLASAQAAFTRVTGALQTSVLAYDAYGASRIKTAGAPPDAWAQMAIQLAHFRAYGFPAPTYESTSTRAFAHGRTETTRSASAAAMAFVTAMDARPALASPLHTTYKHRLMLEACAQHSIIAKTAKAGMGVDRHLLGLRMCATALATEGVRASGGEDAGTAPLHAFFSHPTVAQSKHWRLSTSHCGSEATSLFGFGPVVEDGFGVAYFVSRTNMAFNVTAWSGLGSSPSTSAAHLSEALRASLDDMSALADACAANQR